MKLCAEVLPADLHVIKPHNPLDWRCNGVDLELDRGMSVGFKGSNETAWTSGGWRMCDPDRSSAGQWRKLWSPSACVTQKVKFSTARSTSVNTGGFERVELSALVERVVNQQ